MNTIAWAFILVSLLIVRQVFRGRIMNIGEDLADAFTAITTGDTDALGAVLTRTGDSNTPSQAAATTSTSGDVPAVASGLVAATERRGKAAKGYRWAATGPDYYDCSGLMWRACQDEGYSGGRFSTADVPGLSAFTRLDNPAANTHDAQARGAAGPGDIVLWPAGSGGVTGHMGVITGTDTFYSARSVRSGIGESKISTFRKTTPRYYRFVSKRSGQ